MSLINEFDGTNKPDAPCVLYYSREAHQTCGASKALIRATGETMLYTVAYPTEDHARSRYGWGDAKIVWRGKDSQWGYAGACSREEVYKYNNLGKPVPHLIKIPR